MKGNKIINGSRWIAYFDILGFSNMVESFPVWFVLKAYQEALKESETYNLCGKFIFFSDSFIFYTKDDSQDCLRDISTVTAMFFQNMFNKYIPLRGCLNVGQFYTNEENGIYFGRALIEAYRLAESQNWIGFVLSKNTREKLERFESAGLKSNIRGRFSEYKVPFKKEPEQCNLCAYKFNIYTSIADLEMTLGNMESSAITQLTSLKKARNIDDLKKCPEYKKIITKYENTKKYLVALKKET